MRGWAMMGLFGAGCTNEGGKDSSDDPSITDGGGDEGGDDSGATDDSGEPTGDDSGTEGWTAPQGGVIELGTRDDLTLVADYYPAPEESAPAVVLLHMYATYYDRTDWPLEFIDGLHAAGLTVLVPDRRGAGDSEGDSEESWDGEKGKWDVEACTLRLAEDGYGALALVGASNGTTSMIDYAAWAPTEGLPEPVALGFMTGGSYTEANTSMEDVPGLPALFVYGSEEATWSVAQQDLDPGSWTFVQYEDGGHGVFLFETNPEVADELQGFLLGQLGG
jgi:hypothetical protein